jgi:hypothetical protein
VASTGQSKPASPGSAPERGVEVLDDRVDREGDLGLLVVDVELDAVGPQFGLGAGQPVEEAVGAFGVGGLLAVD